MRSTDQGGRDVSRRAYEAALVASEDPEDRTRLKKLAELVKSYAGVVGELAVAARDYGNTVDKVKRGNALGKEIDLLLGTTTEALIAAAGERKARANAQAVNSSAGSPSAWAYS